MQSLRIQILKYQGFLVNSSTWGVKPHCLGTWRLRESLEFVCQAGRLSELSEGQGFDFRICGLIFGVYPGLKGR